MGWIARSPLATAVSRAGGVGIIETSSGETANGLSEITQMVASDLPFGVKLPIRFLKHDAMLRFGCEAGIRFITTSAASPANFIAPLKAADIVGWWQAPKAAASRTRKLSAGSCCCWPSWPPTPPAPAPGC